MWVFCLHQKVFSCKLLHHIIIKQLFTQISQVNNTDNFTLEFSPIFLLTTIIIKLTYPRLFYQKCMGVPKRSQGSCSTYKLANECLHKCSFSKY